MMTQTGNRSLLEKVTLVTLLPLSAVSMRLSHFAQNTLKHTYTADKGRSVTSVTTPANDQSAAMWAAEELGQWMVSANLADAHDHERLATMWAAEDDKGFGKWKQKEIYYCKLQESLAKPEAHDEAAAM